MGHGHHMRHELKSAHLLGGRQVVWVLTDWDDIPRPDAMPLSFDVSSVHGFVLATFSTAQLWPCTDASLEVCFGVGHICLG